MWWIANGDSRDVLRAMADASVDSVVCDPPYELGFMGKRWDASGIAYDVGLWAEVLRVLKPGGHLLAFGGTRTYHRMACAIEDAGFEVRDSIHWIYGSGFPKSLDVSKAIDKRGGVMPWQADFARHLRAVKPADVTTAQINAHVANGTKSNFWGHFIDTTSQPLLPTVEQYRRLREIVPIGPVWDELFLPEAEREVVGETTSTTLEVAPGEGRDRPQVVVPITAPATDAARQWAGWHTALKPAHEPVVVARKPLDGTVAANVLAHGTGAINVDGCRVGIDKVVGQRLSLGEWEHVESLCDLCAAAANKNAKPETRAIAESIAARSVALTQSAEGRMSRALTSPVTDTGCLNGQSKAEPSGRQNGVLNLSIAAYGGKQTETSQATVSFITSTETSSTTGWKTCKSCGALITDMSITGIQSAQQSIGANGEIGIQNIRPSTPSESVNADNASGPAGRFPPNILLSHTPDCSDECADGCAVAEMDEQSGGASRFFPVFRYQAKAPTSERFAASDGTRHPTQKPVALMRWLVRLVTPPNGLVLDPFTGSGSTGVAAMLEGFRFAGVELSPEYVEIARARVAHAEASRPTTLPGLGVV